MITLPEFTDPARCPKCSYDAIDTAYHKSAHERCPAFGDGWGLYTAVCSLITTSESPLRGNGQLTPEKRKEYEERLIRVVSEWSEHLDRTCHRCAYSWSEGLAVIVLAKDVSTA